MSHTLDKKNDGVKTSELRKNGCHVVSLRLARAVCIPRRRPTNSLVCNRFNGLDLLMGWLWVGERVLRGG